MNVKILAHLNPALLKDFFLKNMGLRQTIAKNTFWLALAEGATSILRFVLIVYAVRVLGAQEYGRFAFAFSFAALFSIFSDLGISNFLVREFSKNREREKNYPAIISLKIALSFLVLCATFIASFFISEESVVRNIVWVLMVYIFIDGFFTIIYPFVRARQKMQYEALFKTAQTFFTALIGLFIIYYLPSAFNFSFAYLLGSIIVLLAVALYFHLFVYRLKLTFDFFFWKKLLQESWPLSFGFMGVWAYINLDSTMIGFMGNDSEVGWFNAAAKIILTIILVLAGLFARSFYPAMSGLLRNSTERLQRSWNYYINIMIVLALPLMVGGLVFASQIINFVYGLNGFAPSVFIFQILILLAGITFLYYPFSIILIVSDRQKLNFYIIVLGFVLNFVLNIILIPRFGFVAAAVSTVIATAATFILAMFYSKHTAINPFHRSILRVFLLSLLSCAVMIFIITYPIVYNLNLFISIFIGFLAYATTFFAASKFVPPFFKINFK